ncbi:MAG TPA: 6-phospho-beta-glucosidase [Nocardioidaceae bacterium]|nr:6-phospho-beta-glucosidase [Nocardioidaceae bacterium]
MRLTVLGGGGFRVPLVYRALCEEDVDGARVDEVVLHDVSADRLRLMRSVLAHVESGAPPGQAPRVIVTTDLTEAVRGADFVFSAMRVAGLRGRVCDERSAMSAGVLGQETTGAGGVCYGLRTVPEALRVAAVIRDVAPEAWTINFTNPAGMVTEAMGSVLGDRVVGICDSPVGLVRRVARVLDLDAPLGGPTLRDTPGESRNMGPPSGAVRFDYAGLNHLGWLSRVLVDGVDVLPSLLADATRLERIEEGRLFGPEWLRTLGAIPNEYLWYWYFRTDALAAEQSASETRGEFLLRQQAAFYDAVADANDPAAAYGLWDRTRQEREVSYMADSREISGAGERESEDLDGGGYDQVALALLRAIACDRPTELILNLRNRGALPFVDDDAVVEVPCRVDASGPVAADVGPLSAHAQSLVTAVKDVERTAIEAARSGSRDLAVRALALHPLVASVPVARSILDAEIDGLPELAAVITR